MSTKTTGVITNIFVSMTAAVFTTLFTLGLFLMFFSYGFNIFNDDIDETLLPSPSPTPAIDNYNETPADQNPNEIKSYDDVVIPIARKLKPSIVGIRIVISLDSMQSLAYEASGVVYSEDGYIITNYHVLSDAIDNDGETISGTKLDVFVEGENNSYEADIIGFDSLTDLALIKIDSNNLIPASFGNSDKVEVGQMVVAIGSPGGLEFMGSVSQGIISGIDRMVEFEDGTIMQLIQTDAAVNPGNSGGALVNSLGDVIGINNAGLEKDTYEGINFAIPSNLVVDIVNDLKEIGYVSGRSWLGVYIMSDMEFESVKSLYNLPFGVFITDVDELGPAYDAGIRKNDVIIEFNEESITNTSQLRQTLNNTNPNESYLIKIYRTLTDEEIEFEVVLGEKN